MNSVPRSAEFIGGHDFNANLGVRLKMHPRTIGPHGLRNRNKKGRKLLGLLSAYNLKVVNTFFQKDFHITWKSFNEDKTCHMLDVITSSSSFFKCIIDCGVTPKGVRSDHSAVQMVLLNRTINFKTNYVERPVIDWNSISRNPEINRQFNLLLK